MTMHIKDGSGNLKEVIGFYIKRNDALEEVLSGYVRQDAAAKQFYGSGGGGVNPDISIVLTDQSVIDVGGQPGVDAQGSYELRTNGIAYLAGNYTGPTVIPGQWTSPTAAVGADYEAFCTISGTNAFPGGGVMPWSDPLDEWLSLGTSRRWVVLAQGNERISTLLRVTIREAVSQDERASAEIFFDLQRADI